MKGIIIILGSPNDDNGDLSSIAVERCDRGVAEFNVHDDFKILLTGGYGEHFNRTDQPHAHYAKKYIMSKGVPEDQIMDYVLSSNTTEDAELSKPVLDEFNPNEIIIVTSDFHHDRAKWLFENNFPDRKIIMSCSKTVLPEQVLQKMISHEIKSLERLKK